MHAYPVPFNPNRSVNNAIIITGFPSLAGGYSIDMEVFDINGDRVTRRSFTAAADVKWNARTDSGSRVKPGMYIIR